MHRSALARADDARDAAASADRCPGRNHPPVRLVTVGRLGEIGDGPLAKELRSRVVMLGLGCLVDPRPWLPRRAAWSFLVAHSGGTPPLARTFPSPTCQRELVQRVAS